MTIQRRPAGNGITAGDTLALVGDADDVRDTLRVAAAASSFEAWIAEPERVARAILQTDTVPAEHSPEDYARRIIRHIQIARGAIARGDAAEAAWCAVRLGALVREADLKTEWEKFALSGRRSKAGGDRRGDDRKREAELNGALLKRNRKLKLAADTLLAYRKKHSLEHASLKRVLLHLMSDPAHDALNTYQSMKNAYDAAKARE